MQHCHPRTPLRQSFWRSCGCSRSTNVIMVWAWMLWSPYALGTRTELWFGHRCSGERMLSKHERNDGLGMDALVSGWMLSNHERNDGLGMDALVSGCSRSTNVIMVWAWMLWSPHARYGLAMDEVQIHILFKSGHEP